MTTRFRFSALETAKAAVSLYAQTTVNYLAQVAALQVARSLVSRLAQVSAKTTARPHA
jgi:hypothetical protein